MTTRSERADAETGSSFLEASAAVSAAVESGAGLPEVARAAGRALNASVAVVDAAGAVLAVACSSPEDERQVLARGEGIDALDLRVADAVVGELRFRARGARPPDALLRMVGTLIALDVERSRGPERASDAAEASFLADLFNRRTTDRENIVARGKELGADLADGGSVVIVRAHNAQPEEGDWRARVLMLAERGVRGSHRTALAAEIPLAVGQQIAPGAVAAGREELEPSDRELVVLLPGQDADVIRRATEAVRRELEAGLFGHRFAVAVSRPAGDPIDLHRAGAEALLAANVAEVQGDAQLAFEQTGAYRLLLPAMSEDPAELRAFHDETVAPIVSYDEQYETELLRTLEAFLEADGSIASTAQRLFTHRHTIRYRLERVRELTGLDVGSSDGRERLSLGLKAMRVLGIAPRQGPATEPGAEAGRVRKEGVD